MPVWRTVLGCIATILFSCIIAASGKAAATQGDRSESLVMALREIRVWYDKHTSDIRAKFTVVFSNPSAKTYCILPSEMETDFHIVYSDGPLLLGGIGSSTYEPHARNSSDLMLSAPSILPKKAVTLRVTVPVNEVPIKATGYLDFRLQCKPSHKEMLYRGVSIYGHALTTRVELAANWISDEKQWVLRPIPQKKDAGQTPAMSDNERKNASGKSGDGWPIPEGE